MSQDNNRIKEIVKSIDLEKRANEHISEWGIEHNGGKPKADDETHRTYYRRQRDRILYTGGFRRLQGKTQVIAATKNGDHRTRLTHSLEVEQIAISIADALGLNRDLVSAIALGHDIGHTPFGHAVERFLNEKLKDKGGFSHAVQSVRYLQNKHIKLSNEVFEGILKHDTDVYVGGGGKEQFDCSEYNPTEPGSLEAQTVYWADKLAYLTHDFEDFYKQDIYKKAKEENKELEIQLKKILADIIPQKRELILEDINRFETRDLIRNVLGNLLKESLTNINKLTEIYEKIDQDVIKKETKKRILEFEENLEKDGLKIKQIDKKIKDKISEIEERVKIEDNKKQDEIDKIRDEIKAMEAIKKVIKKKAYQKGLIINFDKDYGEVYSKLRGFLDEHYLMSPEVQRSDAKARKIVEALYKDFIENTGILPLNIRNRIYKDNEDVDRVVADYIASMTDRYAEEVFVDLNSIGNHYHD